MASERSLEVLRVIVQDYIASREPVGSKTIAERHAFGVSAATIRNDMAILEEEDLIAAPHTSSGRVPTDKGYRVFVDQLADRRPLTPAQRHAIETFLGRADDLEEVLGRTVRLLSTLTNQVALLQYPNMTRSLVRHVELVRLSDTRLLTVLITDSGNVDQRVIDTGGHVDDELVGEIRAKLNATLGATTLHEAAVALDTLPEQFAREREPLVRRIADSLHEQVGANRRDKLVMAGAANLVRTEKDFTGSIYPVLEAIEEQVTLLRLFSEMDLDESGLSVSIGRENAGFGLAEASVLASGYAASSSGVAKLGVLGPIRMDYTANMAAVRAVARYLSKLLGQE
jgi:heat-inducible transcriptional repressor